MKKTLIAFLILISLISSLVISVSAAPSASASISLSSKSVTVGDTVTVTVKYTSQNQIGSYDFLLKYDANLLQYVSGADVDSANGTLKFANYNDNSDMKTVKLSVKFKALSSGTAKFSTQANAIVDYESFSLMSAKDSTASLTVNPPKTASSENKLSSLTVSGLELSPAFSASVYEYSAEVEYSVKKLAISAIAKDKNAKVSISESELKLGENTVVITVTAENGSKRTYKLNITRKESQMAHIGAEIDGNSYIFAHDPDSLTPPAGFGASSATFQGKEVLAFKDENSIFTIVYLTPVQAPAPSTSSISSSIASSVAASTAPSASTVPSSSTQTNTTEISPAPAKEGWYLYNEADESFMLFNKLSSAALDFVAVPLPSDAVVPSVLQSFSYTQNENSITAYTNDYCKENSLVVLYLKSFSGEEGFFVYDEKNNCYYDYRVPETVTVTVTLTVPATTIEAVAPTDSGNEQDAQLKTATLFAMIAFSLFIILLIVFITVTRSKNTKIKELKQKIESAPARKRVSRDPKDHFGKEKSEATNLLPEGESAKEE